jgi:hypothetical protein
LDGVATKSNGVLPRRHGSTHVAAKCAVKVSLEFEPM